MALHKVQRLLFVSWITINNYIIEKVEDTGILLKNQNFFHYYLNSRAGRQLGVLGLAFYLYP